MNLSINTSFDLVPQNAYDFASTCEQCVEQASIQLRSNALEYFDTTMALGLVANMYLLFHIWKTRKDFDSFKEFARVHLIDFGFILGTTLAYTLIRLKFRTYIFI